MSHGRCIRVLLLLLLTASGAYSPSALAQDTPETPQTQPAICFDKDDGVASEEQLGGACRGDAPAAYMQGDSVGIDVEAAVGLQLFVSVRCVKGCPAADPTTSHVYWAIYRGATLVFPRDFTEKGPENTGANAPADLVPRYNSTWEVTAHFGGTPIARQFQVWLYDAMVGTNMTVRPGESHMLRSTGLTPRSDATLRWERRDPTTGRYFTYLTETRRVGSTGSSVGWLEYPFRLPTSEARNITLCGRAVLDCYRVTVSGDGKEPETVPVQVGLAYIRRSNETTPRPGPTQLPEIQRTQNASFVLDLYYPGGRVHHGPKLQPADIPYNLGFQANGLRVAVEKLYANQSVFLLAEVALLYAPTSFVWQANWTVPKDHPIEPDAFYRLRLLEQRDIHGNIIVEDVLGNFTIASAEIRPLVSKSIDELERTELGTVRIDVRYHNGTPFTPDDASPPGNESPLRGCFLRSADPPPQPAPSPRVNQCAQNDPLTWGTYSDGSWNFTVRYPRDHAELGAYRFFLVNGTTDRYGNTFFGLATADFQLIPARPIVEFSTVMRGVESEVLERGRSVFVAATITYHDGSPYNHAVRVSPNSGEAMVLSGRLVRRGPAPGGSGYGPIAGEDVFNLTESDPTSGRWSGTLDLSDQESTPAGIWTFAFDIVDNLTVPNANSTAFDREIVSSTIVLCPTVQPPFTVATGATIRFRFKLFYSECDTGREISEASLVGKLNAHIHRFDTARQAINATPVSNVLVPTYARDSTLDWGIEYQVADGLFAGSYVIVLTGTDTFGNKLVPASRSRAFSTFTEIVERSTLAQPPFEVKRGETVTVVFDAREGDTGTDPSRPAPRIQLERLDTAATTCATALIEGGCWVRERTDVRLFDPTFEDHLGVFPVGVDTPVGVYRFSLQGRDVTFHLITGLSENFTVNPTQVTRAMLTTPPERIVKGTPFTFYLEQMPGDKLTDKFTYLDGRLARLPNAQVMSEFGRFNVTWAVPFEAPAGNYTLRFDGKDVSGNDIVILTPPIEALSATLEGRMLGHPTRTVPRSDVARIQFAVGYPDGTFYAAPDAPRVFVRNATSVVASATIRREGLSFGADWRVPIDAPLGDYYFEVNPQATGITGNAFPPLRSNSFKVVPGVIVRPAVNEAPAAIDRLASATYGTPFEANDKFVAFDLVYYGPSQSSIVDTLAPPIEVTRSPLPHTIDAVGGRYVARLVTDQQSQTGTFKIIMSGEDAYGNRILSESRQLVVRTTTVLIQLESSPPIEAFGEGKEVSFTFLAKYQIGSVMDDSFGRPSVALLYAQPGQNERPASPKPEIEYLDGHWYMTWTAPDILPPGSYTFLVGGQDIHGNPIASSRSAPYLVGQPTPAESFLKVVPGPSPLLMAFVVVALAAALFGRKRR